MDLLEQVEGRFPKENQASAIEEDWSLGHEERKWPEGIQSIKAVTL